MQMIDYYEHIIPQYQNFISKYKNTKFIFLN